MRPAAFQERAGGTSLLATRHSLLRPRSATALSWYPIAGLALAVTHPRQQYIALVLGLLWHAGLGEREKAGHR
ncbi:hypothetical protein ABZV80_45445 [Streptomyces sp. NPDC005132]|uniref:hypothetical protein n=1 Tax=Streptomyces sp. NPDC005132 TaxID=3154294 RepID=UPI0033BEA27B